MNVHFTPIKPGYINTRRIRGQLIAAINNAAKRWKKMLAEYTSTWEEPPEFKTIGGYRGGNIWVGVTTDDDVFWYLELGTWVRYATMSNNFIAKTTPHSIKSQQGQGSVRYVDKRIPRPGIEPREILNEIMNVDTPHWESDMHNIFANIRFTSDKESHLG